MLGRSTPSAATCTSRGPGRSTGRHRAGSPRFLVFGDGFGVLVARAVLAAGRRRERLSPARSGADRRRPGADRGAARRRDRWLAERGVDVLASDAEVPAATGYPSKLRASGFRPIEEIQPSRHRMTLSLDGRRGGGPRADREEDSDNRIRRARARADGRARNRTSTCSTTCSGRPASDGSSGSGRATSSSAGGAARTPRDTCSTSTRALQMAPRRSRRSCATATAAGSRPSTRPIGPSSGAITRAPSHYCAGRPSGGRSRRVARRWTWAESTSPARGGSPWRANRRTACTTTSEPSGRRGSSFRGAHERVIRPWRYAIGRVTARLVRSRS